jgi:hypothetical protein
MLRYANIYFDESGDTGDPHEKGNATENFAVGCVYVPDYNHKACLTSLEPLLGWSSSNPALEIKAKYSTPEKIEQVLQELVKHDCRFGAMQINKRAAKNYSSLSTKEAKRVRTNMILSLLESIIKQEKIKLVINAHIDRFPATDEERRDLGDYLAYRIDVEFGNTLFAIHPSSHKCLGVRCADHVAYSMYKNADPEYSQLFDVIAENTVTWSEITSADFFKIS